MSVLQVTCPACKTTSNVVATMTNVRCPQCGAVFNARTPVQAAPAGQAQANPASTNADDDDADSSDWSQYAPVIAGIVGLCLLMLILVGASIAMSRSKPAAVDPVTEDTAMDAAKSDEPEFRVVNLPESTRRTIYHDYRRLAGSSIDKKVPLQKDAPARQKLDKVLNQIVDREITHFALNYGISEDDVRQIVAEGDAKQWSINSSQRSVEALPTQ
ncbi:zinc ribbon domain-containing protein [Stieleria varia]|uniref:Uncharacterized protein n=1 Tax=Stieleria varia TaxID=2528005 RepID=A0A5C6AFM4_9BACT|nr:hypothetical protein [Stieleria varia]TWT98409.1 hypothetical protein Pla52n_49220 [Stieleria varia]